MTPRLEGKSFFWWWLLIRLGLGGRVRRAHALGLGILAVTIAASIGLETLGRSQQPQLFSVPFERGAALVDDASTTIDYVAGVLHRHPQHRVVLEGHTGTLGNDAANRSLSEDRAQRVAAALAEAGIDEARIELLALGGSSPLEQEADESSAAWQRRLGRVEVIVVPP